jgi:putative transposase
MKSRRLTLAPTAKLTQAGALAAEGKLQPEIARVLGISVMTLHRWRKAQATAGAPVAKMPSTPIPSGGDNRIAELQLENSRLRKLVTDLLLEKMKLEEASKAQKLPGKPQL